MPRYIDADKVEKWSWQEPRYSDSINDRTDLRDFLRSLPTLTPDEVRGAGHWVTEQEAIDADDYSLRDTCSVCGRCDWDCTESASFKYCPNCGAKMKGAETSE